MNNALRKLPPFPLRFTEVNERYAPCALLYAFIWTRTRDTPAPTDRGTHETELEG